MPPSIAIAEEEDLQLKSAISENSTEEITSHDSVSNWQQNNLSPRNAGKSLQAEKKKQISLGFSCHSVGWILFKGKFFFAFCMACGRVCSASFFCEWFSGFPYANFAALQDEWQFSVLNFKQLPLAVMIIGENINNKGAYAFLFDVTYVIFQQSILRNKQLYSELKDCPEI